MHFGLLTQWYPPEPGPAALSGDLAEGLVARGHQVDVVTGFPNYPTGRLAHGYRIQRHQRDRAGDLTVHRVALYPAHSASTASRLANYGSFAISAAVSGHRILSRCDALWVNYSPITVSLAMWAARRLREVPVRLRRRRKAGVAGPPGPGPLVRGDLQLVRGGDPYRARRRRCVVGAGGPA